MGAWYGRPLRHVRRPEAPRIVTYTVAQVAEMLQVSETTLREWGSRGYVTLRKLPSGVVRILAQDVDAMLRRRE